MARCDVDFSVEKFPGQLLQHRHRKLAAGVYEVFKVANRHIQIPRERTEVRLEAPGANDGAKHIRAIFDFHGGAAREIRRAGCWVKC